MWSPLESKKGSLNELECNRINETLVVDPKTMYLHYEEMQTKWRHWNECMNM